MVKEIAQVVVQQRSLAGRQFLLYFTNLNLRKFQNYHFTAKHFLPHIVYIQNEFCELSFRFLVSHKCDKF